MNRDLSRQLGRLGLDPETPPADLEQWKAFLGRVTSFYDDAEQNRYLLERSLEMSSQETEQL